MHTISWIMTLLALFGWGVTTPSTTQHQSRPGLTQSSPGHSAAPTPLPATPKSPSPAPKSSAQPTPVAGTPTEIASEAACPGQADPSRTIQALTCLTNNARVFHGLRPVADNQALLAAAAAKDQDMAKCGYGHTACGQVFQHEILAKGYAGKCYGENIAMGQRSPHDVFVAWMNSPGHRANILNANYRDLGVAELAGSGGPLWTMELGGC